MGYRICYYTRYEQQKKGQTEVAAAREVSNQARHVSHARTHARTHIFTSKSEISNGGQTTTTKNQENIKQLMENNKVRTSQPAWPVLHRTLLNNKSRPTTTPGQARPHQEGKTDRRYITPNFQTLKASQIFSTPHQTRSSPQS